VLRKRVAVLVAAAVMMLSMLVVAAPALAMPEDHPGQGSGATDSNPGGSEGSKSHNSTPPPLQPGATVRDPGADPNDPFDGRTGRGERNCLDCP
jgi:hypothetical protein